jgi:acyl dehydratase
MIDFDRIGATSEPAVHSWRARDCSLYALAVGAGFDDRAFVLDGEPGQRVYPSFPLTILALDGESRDDEMFGIGDFTGRTQVMGEQHLVLHRPVIPSGAVSLVTRVVDVFDKGSGALIVLEAHGSEPSTDAALFTSTISMFVVGEGGFGGARGPARRTNAWPARPPDAVGTLATTAVQGLWYRHAGNDTHTIHIDHDAGRAAGLDGAILTGQNTLGIAGRAVVHAVCGGDPEPVLSIGGRFATPAYNGDVLITEMWTLDGPSGVEPGGGAAAVRHVLFRVVNQDGAVLVDDGVCDLAT